MMLPRMSIAALQSGAMSARPLTLSAMNPNVVGYTFSNCPQSAG